MLSRVCAGTKHSILSPTSNHTGGEDTEGKKDKKKDKTENGHEMAPLSKSVRRHSLPARTDVAGNVDKVDAIDRAQRSRGHNADPALVPLGGVKMDHVTCSWADHRVAVKDISFELAPGELLAIVGPVGAGKSTIFMALLGELIPDSGAIDLNGTLVYDAQEPWILSHVSWTRRRRREREVEEEEEDGHVVHGC